MGYRIHHVFDAVTAKATEPIGFGFIGLIHENAGVERRCIIKFFIATKTIGLLILRYFLFVCQIAGKGLDRLAKFAFYYGRALRDG